MFYNKIIQLNDLKKIKEEDKIVILNSISLIKNKIEKNNTKIIKYTEISKGTDVSDIKISEEKEKSIKVDNKNISHINKKIKNYISNAAIINLPNVNRIKKESSWTSFFEDFPNQKVIKNKSAGKLVSQNEYRLIQQS